MKPFDPRIHAVRPDLADHRLRGQVPASRFAVGRHARIAIPLAGLRGKPNFDAPMTTQLLLGDPVTVFDEAKGWVWLQSDRDGYVGYLPGSAVEPRSEAATHLVSAPRTFLYPRPDLKLPRNGDLSMGASVTVRDFEEVRGTLYAYVSTRDWIVARHLAAVGESVADYVDVAETLLNTPYLWGGVSGYGIDCSGLVQLSMRMAGRDVLRDTDLQAETIGDVLDPGEDLQNLRRGDLVFWKGHVAIMTDEKTMIHANGHTMLVSREPLREAIDRIGYLYGGPTGFRRP